MDQHSVQSVGDFSACIIHPLINGGLSTTLSGFKMEGDIINTAQLIENSKVVPLLMGDSITITNNNKSGTITFSCVKHTNNPLKGDITAIANQLLEIGDNIGGTIRISFGFNGATYAMTFITCTLKKNDPLKLAGNDVPDYAIEFNYASYTDK